MRILIINNRAIDISTDEAYESIALSIVNERLNLGFYKEPIEPIKPEMSRDQLKKLPIGQIRNYGNHLWQQYREKLQSWEQQQAMWQRIKECIDNKDGKAAIIILNDRKKFVKEEFQVYEVQQTY